jgi:outer membrane protein assembly factor BamB
MIDISELQIRNCRKRASGKRIVLYFGLIALGSAAFVGSPSTAFASWPQYGLNASHTSFNKTETTLTRGNVPKLKWRWAGDVGDKECSAPLVGQRTVFVGSNGMFHAYAASNGLILWSQGTCGGAGVVRMALGKYGLFVSDGSDFAGYNPTTAAQMWCYDEFVGSPCAVAGDRVYANNQSAPAALDQSTGDYQWIFTQFGEVGTPAVANGVVYVTGNNSVIALNKITGQQIWSTQLGPQPRLSSASVSGGTVYVGGSGLFALSASDGHILWSTQIVGVNVTTPAIAYGKVFVNSQQPNLGLWAFDAATGAFVWKNKSTGESSATVSVANGVVYEIAETGELMMFNSDTGVLVGSVVDPDGRPFDSDVGSQVAVTNATVYVPTADSVLRNRVDAFRLP